MTLGFHYHPMRDCELWAYDGPEELLINEVNNYTLRSMDLTIENHLYYECRFGACSQFQCELAHYIIGFYQYW